MEDDRPNCAPIYVFTPSDDGQGRDTTQQGRPTLGQRAANLFSHHLPHHQHSHQHHMHHGHHQGVNRPLGYHHGRASSYELGAIRNKGKTSPTGSCPDGVTIPDQVSNGQLSTLAGGDANKDQQGEECNFDIVKATQHGIFERCRELIEAGQDVNERDSENVTLLHWAAINNRRDLVKYYINKGALVDAVGGELQSTPLHWATRQGHLSMVILLMQYGADPNLYDGEGCNCLHLAAQFGHTAIVAYLVAKGADINCPDSEGKTALMWSCFRVLTADPTRLLLTLGASHSLVDHKHGNTALHWAVYSRNTTAVNLLLKAGASVTVKNALGDTPLTMAQRFHLHWIAKRIHEIVQEKELHNKHLCIRLYRDKVSLL